MVAMLEDVVQFGTGVRAKELGRPSAGKTGTTNDFTDAWYIGFTPATYGWRVVGTTTSACRSGKRNGRESGIANLAGIHARRHPIFAQRKLSECRPTGKTCRNKAGPGRRAGYCAPADAAEQGLQEKPVTAPAQIEPVPKLPEPASTRPQRATAITKPRS